MAHLHVVPQHRGLHNVQPLVSLRAFDVATSSLRSASDRYPHAYRSRARRTNDVATRARPGGGTDPEVMREIARLMPDPAGGDDLFASDPPERSSNAWGSSSGAPSSVDRRMQDAYNDLLTGSDLFGNKSEGYGRELISDDEDSMTGLEHLNPAQRQKLLEKEMIDAREEWEVEAAQEKAMELHSDHMRSHPNRYEMTMRFAETMRELERHDYYAGDGQDRIPSWVRAHFLLEQELELERALSDPASLQNEAGAQQSQEDSLNRPMAEILPGSDTTLSINSALQEMIGENDELRTYESPAVDDDFDSETKDEGNDISNEEEAPEDARADDFEAAAAELYTRMEPGQALMNVNYNQMEEDAGDGEND